MQPWQPCSEACLLQRGKFHKSTGAGLAGEHLAWEAGGYVRQWEG
jgi:hypothetical protein